MARNTVPDTYRNAFSDDWRSDMMRTLLQYKDYRTSELSLRLVRQEIKSKLEAEIYLDATQSELPPHRIVTKDRIANIFQFSLESEVWPIYGLGCGHCVGDLTSFGPFPSPSVVENASLVATNYRTILNELRTIRNRIHTETREFIYTGTWRSLTLWESNIATDLPATKIFKETMELLMSMPSFQTIYELSSTSPSFRGFTVRISQLKPNTIILPHFGLTNTRLRLQIPLIIPQGDLFIYAHDKTSTWQLGQPLILDDSFIHGVYNHTNDDRIVLLVDLPHPEASLDAIMAY